MHRDRLTRALAEGADPAASAELAAYARRLTSDRTRRVLARTLRRIVGEAHRPPVTRTMVAIVDRRAVLDAEAAIEEMIGRLGAPAPVRARGMALLQRIITNADRSPLYGQDTPGLLRRMIRSATAALDDRPSQSHEFSLLV